MVFRGTPKEYEKAAEAVAAGTADQEQKDANARMARNTRAGSTAAQNAQDAYKTK
jgi:hypothetical protein